MGKHFDPVLKTYLHQCRLMTTYPDAFMELFSENGTVVQFTQRSAAWELDYRPRHPVTKIMVIDKSDEYRRVFHYLFSLMFLDGHCERLRHTQKCRLVHRTGDGPDDETVNATLMVACAW